MQWMGVKITTRRARDWFRFRYWVRCWFCDYSAGPFLSETEQIKHLRHECTDPDWDKEIPA